MAQPTGVAGFSPARGKATALAIAWLMFSAVLIMPLFPAAQEASAAASGAIQKEQADRAKKLQRDGKALRAAIDEQYKKLVDPKNHLNPAKDNDISQIVRHFIPAGTWIDDVKEIFITAGFNIQDYHKPDNSFESFNMVASINPYSEKYPCNTSIYAHLAFEASGNYDVVKSVHAVIDITCLKL